MHFRQVCYVIPHFESQAYNSKKKRKKKNLKITSFCGCDIFSSMMGESDDKRGFFKKLLTVPSTETDAIRLVSPLF
jgi:hypothetical protein